MFPGSYQTALLSGHPCISVENAIFRTNYRQSEIVISAGYLRSSELFFNPKGHNYELALELAIYNMLVDMYHGPYLYIAN